MKTSRRILTTAAPTTASTIMTAESTGAAEDRPSAHAVVEPVPGDVARRAYELFEQRGREHGRDLDDWYQAERELQTREPDFPWR